MTDKEKMAIERIKMAAQTSEGFYHEPVIVCYSGGKDSELLLELAKQSGVNFEVLHNHTTVDAPETVYHIRKKFAELENNGIKCTINYPKLTMWQLIVKKKMPPTRLIRYCCAYLKERGGDGRHIMTGVRWDESVKRKKRGIYETQNKDISKRVILTNDNDDRRRLDEFCMTRRKSITNPIIDWTKAERDAWLNEQKVECNPLYDCGFKRVGCVGCPMASKNEKIKEFRRYPKFKENYIRAFDKAIEARKENGLKIGKWETGKEMFNWWIDEDYNKDQLALFEEGEYEDEIDYDD